MRKKYTGRKLPQPNVRFRTADQLGDLTPADLRGIICNPVYAGLGPFPAIVSDEEWVTAAARAIREDGAEQFLVNLLHVLRATFADES
jgi:hypothetical protein